MSADQLNSTNSTFETVIADLKHKASNHRSRANVMLIVVTIIIFIGLGIFIGAYELTSKSDLNAVIASEEQLLKDHLTKVRNESRATQRHTDVLTEEIRKGLRSLGQLGFTWNSAAITPESPAELERARSSPRLANLLDSMYLKIFALNGGYQTPSYKELSDSAIQKETTRISNTVLEKLRTTNYEMNSLINTGLVRFGSIVIVLFLVQILIRVFRYSTKLSSFYEARASALEIYVANRGNKDKLTLEMITAMLSTDSIDMDIPKTPTDHFSEWVKAGLGNISKPKSQQEHD